MYTSKGKAGLDVSTIGYYALPSTVSLSLLRRLQSCCFYLWTGRANEGLPKPLRRRAPVMASRNTVAGAVVALLYCLLGGDSQYDSCTTGTVADIGNGRCDTELNVIACGYDGGDCCPCTCVDGPAFSCSDNVFDCLYPDCGSAVATVSGSTCVESFKSDGFCDPQNNGPECGFDGGDVSHVLKLKVHAVVRTNLR